MKNLIECSVKLGKSSGRKFDTAVSGLAIFFLRAYKLLISPWLGSACRFEPSCSQYAIEAYQNFPPATATWLTTKRLCKCHPLGSYGYDPLPAKAIKRESLLC